MPKRPTRPVRHYIRQIRKSHDLTLEEVAERLGERLDGFTHASLSRIETGKQGYSQEVLEALADELTDGNIARLFIRPPKP
jgi:transcriptional regulator with XRE-family HTH domain